MTGLRMPSLLTPPPPAFRRLSGGGVMSRRRNFARTLTAAFLLAVAAALLLLPSAPGHAQTTTYTYVSNIDQGDTVYSSTLLRAQRFTTGSQSGGYTVTSVDIGYEDDEGDKFSAAIWKVDSVDVPDTGTSASKVADLTAPTGTWSAGDTLTFTAPAGTTLDVSTTYAVVLTNTGNAVGLASTTSHGEDSGTFAGWSIADVVLFSNNNTSWLTHPGGEILRIAIKGTTAAAAAAAWNATLTSADNWAVGSTYTYDGYGSSAADYLTTTHGSLSPGSFTVGGTTHTVELLGVRGGTESRLYLLTDTGVSKSDLAGYAMEFTVDGSTTTLKVSDATNAVVSTTNVGIYWAESRHSFGPDDWQAKTITVKLLLIVPGAPTGLTVTEGHHAVQLDWTAPADNGGSAITEYAIGVWVGGLWLTLADKPTGTSYTYDGSDDSYRFRVRAINANGNGDWSTVVMGVTIGPATVTIAGDGGVNEGFNAEFTLTASKPVLSSSKPLDVSVSVSESEDVVASAEEGAKTVSFAMGDTIATLSVPTVDDGVVESDSVVTAAIQTNTDYTVGTDGSGTVTVADNDTTANNPATGAPTITGTAQVGQTLTAATGGIMDTDGLTSPTYTYQWIRVNGTEADISGATSLTYTLVAADLGKTIKVKVSFTDDASNAETLTSAATSAVTAAVTDDCAGDWTSTCSVSPGSSVTGDVESSGDRDSFRLSATSGVTYRIDAEGSPTSMGTLANPAIELRDSSWTQLTANDDGGAGLNARVTWTAGSTGNVFVVIRASNSMDTGTYTLTVSVTGNTPATGAPTISGTAQVGQTLTAATSDIMDADGLTTPGYTYQWVRVNGTESDISGAMSSTYTLVAADLGKTIKVKVSFTDDASNAETLTSAATSAVSPAAAGRLVSIAVEGDAEIIDQFIVGIGVPKVKFRVSIPTALTANLDVTINISEVSDTRTDLGNAQTADHVAAADEGNKTVTIAAGDTSAVHEVEVQRDGTFEQDGDVRAEVAPGFGYRASASARSASVRVLDTAQPFRVRALHSDGSPLTGGARLAYIRVDEGARRVVVMAECVTLYDREPRRQSIKISLTSQKITTAEYRNDEDYKSFAEQMSCSDQDDPALGLSGSNWSATGFRRVQRDGGYIYQSVVTIVGLITDDQVYDPDETFRVALQRGPNLPNYVELVTARAPGSTNSNSSHLVIILDDARAPANLEATVEGVVVGLTWDELPGPRAVETYEVKVNDGPWRALDTGPSTHGVVGGLTPGVENTITVGARYWGPERPRFGRGDCDVFNCSVKVMGPMLDTAHADGPGAVTGLAVSRMGLGEAKLTWTPPSDTGASGISGYQWRATGGSFDVEPELLNRWHDIAPSVMETNGNTTSAIINWMEGVDHTIYVRAWSGLRKYPGAVASVTLTGTGANQPTNLRATTVADTWVTLSWTAPSVRPETIDEYHVETRDPFTDNQWSFGGEGTGGTGTSYTVEGLEPGVEYIFRVRGRSDSMGLFTPSDYFARGTRGAGSPAQALAHVVYPPGATSLFASANGGSRIDLGWITTNPASTSYDLEWSADGETGWQAVDPPDDGADTTYGHTGLTAETTYYYRVRGVNGDACAKGGAGRQQPGHGRAVHQRHGAGGPDADSGHVGHRRC